MGGKVGDFDGFGLIAAAGNVINFAFMQGGGECSVVCAQIGDTAVCMYAHQACAATAEGWCAGKDGHILPTAKNHAAGRAALGVKRVFGCRVPIIQRENRSQAGILQPDKAAGGSGKVQGITIGKVHGHRAIQLEHTAVLDNRVTVAAVRRADIDPDIDG